MNLSMGKNCLWQDINGDELRDYSEYPIKFEERMTLIIMYEIVTIGLCVLVYDSVLPAILTPLLWKPILTRYSAYKSEKMRKDFRNDFKDVLYALSTTFATGKPLSEGIIEAQKSLSLLHSEDAPIMKELENMRRRIVILREPDVDVLEDLGNRTRIQDVEDFAMMYKCCKETGGDMESVVSRGATIIIDKISVEKDVETMTIQKKVEGRIIGAIPLVLLIFLRYVAPDYIEPLYTGIVGRLIMTLAVIICVVAFYLIERITKIEV